MIIEELNSIADRYNNKKIISIIPANIQASEGNGKYTIKFKNNSTAKNVPGTAGLVAGASIMVAKYAGNTGIYSVLGASRGSLGNTTRLQV